MPAPDIGFVKDWCRIDSDAFDGILPTMIQFATDLATHETGRDYGTEDMPAAVQAWCAAQVAYWINNPEAATDKQMMPSPFHRGLLDPYRTYA